MSIKVLLRGIRALFGAFLLLAIQTGRAEYSPREAAPGVTQIGRIEAAEIIESSGVIPCKFDTNVFWTHNDGPGKKLYAITRTGKLVSEFLVEGPAVNDWEDIARDDQGHLYLADIGNNNEVRSELVIHRFNEPDPAKKSDPLKVDRTWKLRFPQKPFNCESLFIWGDYGYVISKVFDDASAEIYRFSLAEQKEPAVFEFVAKLPVTSPVTGADISRDGKKLGLVCKSGAYLFSVDGDLKQAGKLPYGRVKFREGQIEGCCFVEEGLLATSEKREVFLFTEAAFRKK